MRGFLSACLYVSLCLISLCIPFVCLRQHLGCTVADPEELQEMVCEGCMNKAPFLWTYAAHFAGSSFYNTKMSQACLHLTVTSRESLCFILTLPFSTTCDQRQPSRGRRCRSRCGGRSREGRWLWAQSEQGGGTDHQHRAHKAGGGKGFL